MHMFCLTSVHVICIHHDTSHGGIINKHFALYDKHFVKEMYIR